MSHESCRVCGTGLELMDFWSPDGQWEEPVCPNPACSESIHFGPINVGIQDCVLQRPENLPARVRVRLTKQLQTHFELREQLERIQLLLEGSEADVKAMVAMANVFTDAHSSPTTLSHHTFAAGFSTMFPYIED